MRKVPPSGVGRRVSGVRKANNGQARARPADMGFDRNVAPRPHDAEAPRGNLAMFEVCPRREGVSRDHGTAPNSRT